MNKVRKHNFLERKTKAMVPVLDNNNQPMMPCSEKRARKMMERGEAQAYWQKGIFTIKLIKEPSGRDCQPIALGIDPGSKREGYTVATEKRVVLNITTNTPDWVKDHVGTRRNLRRARRDRKTPYRQCRSNRVIGGIPPSTKARWNAKLRILRSLLKILPITIINVEDIKAWNKEGQRQWNASFSPLEVGKSWFYQGIENLGLILLKTKGYDTKQHRDKRGFQKSKDKLSFQWESHCVDSHSLVEMSLGKELTPYLGIWQINFLEYHRRQLHVQNPSTDSIRKQYGTTVSMGMPKGATVRYRGKLYYLGGSSKGKVAIHSIITGKRVKQFVKKRDIGVLYTQNRRVQFLPRQKPWVSMHNFA
jgi:hypothetical protein